MRRPAVEPDQDAIDLLASRLGRRKCSSVGAQTKNVREAKTHHRAHAELNEIPARHSGAIASELTHGFQCILWHFRGICEVRIRDQLETGRSVHRHRTPRSLTFPSMRLILFPIAHCFKLNDSTQTPPS